MQGLARIIGNDEGLRDVVQRARRLASVDATVLLEGETGVGKEVFARAIHDASQHRSGPFIALNCGGLSRELLASELFGYVDGAFTGARRSGMLGKLESAHGGTLFLDEIAEMPLDLQPYLLRVLEGGEVYPLGSTKARQVHFRLISACNRQLRGEISAGRFRTDLYYRISVTSLQIPALRERTRDLPALVQHFAEDVATRHAIPIKRFAHEVLQVFARYSWPGNVRELRNVVEAMVLLTNGDVVDLNALPADLINQVSLGDEAPASSVRRAHYGGLGRAERDAISAAIRTHQGNLTQVARDLRISRSTLYLKVKKHALDPLLNEARLG
jgi:sigma-54 dependent transcriptional regulator, acetoin dehydrogenase operon transcriptional activator AcoR